jgi:hypothetical protein
MRTLQSWAWVAIATVAAAGGAASFADEARAAPPAATTAAPAATSRPTAANATVVRLSRLHHVAEREIQLGRLAQIGANRPETRAYGAELVKDFQALDERILSLARDLGVEPARLGTVYAGENTAALRREADDLTKLGAARGDAFDRQFWVVVAHDQLAAADMLLPVVGADPRLEPIVADLSQQLDASSRLAVSAAQPVSTTPPEAVPPPVVPSPDIPAPPVTPPLPSGVELPPVPGRDIIPPPGP